MNIHLSNVAVSSLRQPPCWTHRWKYSMSSQCNQRPLLLEFIHNHPQMQMLACTHPTSIGLAVLFYMDLKKMYYVIWSHELSWVSWLPMQLWKSESWDNVIYSSGSCSWNCASHSPINTSWLMNAQHPKPPPPHPRWSPQYPRRGAPGRGGPVAHIHASLVYAPFFW